MSIIRVERLEKTFPVKVRRDRPFATLRDFVHPLKRDVRAIQDISFSVAEGESVAYLGPNGAGKSTTIKILSGILVPTSGSVEVADVVPWKRRRQLSYHMGVVFGQRTQLSPDLCALDSFDLLRYMYSIPRERFRENLQRYAEMLDADSFMRQPVRTLSLGQRMRCEIIAALLHDPEILFLDEPTIGLDVVAKERIREFIRELNRERGVTILLTTHDLGDIERLCKRIVIIDKGRIMYDGDLAGLRATVARDRRIVVSLADAAAAAQALGKLERDASLKCMAEEARLSIVYDQQTTDTAELIRRLYTMCEPRDLVVREEDVETIVRRFYEGTSGERG